MLQSVAALVVVAACRARPVHGTLSQTDDGARDEGLLETFGRAPGEPPGRFWARHAAYEGRRADAAEAATHEARKLFAERLSGLETDLTQTIERAYQARVAAAARDRDAALEVVYAKAHGEFLAAMRYREEALAALHGRVDTEFDEAFDPTSYASAFNADEVRAARGAAGDDDAVIDDDDAAQPSLRPTTPAFDELATKYPTPSRTCFWRRVDGAREFRACGDATPFLRVADLDMYGDVAYLGLCEDAVSRRGCLAIARCSTVEWREVVEWTPDLCGIDDEVPETPSERPCYWEFAAGERTDSGALTYYGCPRTPLATFPRGHAPLDDEDEHYSRHVLPSATFFGPCAGAISLAECFTAARCWKEEARPWRNDIRGGRKSCDPVPPPSGSEIDNVYATSSAAAKPATTCFRGVPRYGVAYYFACGLFEPLARVSVVDYKVGDRVDDGVVHEVETSFTGPCADVATLDDCLVEAGCSKIAPPWTDARLCEGASMHATDFLSVYAKDLATAWSKVYSVIGDNDDKPPPEDGCPELRPLDEDECPDYDNGHLVWYFECIRRADIPWMTPPPPLGREYSVKPSRAAAAAGTRTFRETESRRRRGWDVTIPRSRVETRKFGRDRRARLRCDNKALKLNDMCKSNGGECGTREAARQTVVCFEKQLDHPRTGRGAAAAASSSVLGRVASDAVGRDAEISRTGHGESNDASSGRGRHS